MFAKKTKTPAMILSFVIIVAMVLTVMISQQKSEFVILKSVEINKPTADIFPMINDLKNWRSWSPWYAQDMQAFVDYSETTAGRDAWVQWTSEATSSGKITIKDVVRDDAFKMQLNLKDLTNTEALLFFKIRQVKDSTTEVLWRLEGKNDGVFNKVISVFSSTPSALEEAMTQGLQNLKASAEK